MEKIDFVLPWVDGSDEQWLEKKAKYSNTKLEKGSDSAHRFRDLETLKYVLRGIHINCPWYNKIYIITEGHFPEWLDIKHPKITLITHEELYFDKSHLPVFNSSSIEMNLANIKGLSEKFIYLNDDFLIISKLSKERFFRNNKPIDFFSHGWLPRNKIFGLFKGIGTWIHSINNNINLINREFKFKKLDNKYLFHSSYLSKTKLSNFLYKFFYKNIFWLEHWHHPQPYLLTTLQEVHKRFEKEMMVSSSNRFRANNDLTQYLYRYWHLLNENFEPHRYNDDYVLNIISKESFDKGLRYIKTTKELNFICFNDSPQLGNNEFEYIKTSLLNYLEKILPQKAPFEI